MSTEATVQNQTQQIPIVTTKKGNFFVDVIKGVRKHFNKQFVTELITAMLSEMITAFFLTIAGTLTTYARKRPTEIVQPQVLGPANKTFNAPPPPPPGYPGGGYPGSTAFSVAPTPSSPPPGYGFPVR